MLWHIELKFFIWLCFTILQIKSECHQFASIFVGVMPLLELRILEIQFSTLFSYMLSWNFAYDFVLLYYRPSSNVVDLRQFLWELCPFWNLEYWKYSFRTFLIHALTYWAEIFHMTLFYYTSDQVRVSSISSIFVGVIPLLELRILEIVFHTFLLHVELKFCIWLCFTVLQIKFECR